MAFEDLSAFAAIWLGRGLRCLLLESEAAAAAAQAPQAARARFGAKAPRPSVQQKPAPSQRLDAPKSAPSWRPMPVESWPAAWQEQLKKTLPGKIAWTYRELGDDLRAGKRGRQNEPQSEAEARAKRGQTLRSLIAALRHPAGTHTFWPCQLSAEEGIQPDLFWSGLRALGCRGAVVMDPGCFQILLAMPGARPPFGARMHGAQAWLTHPINAIPDLEVIATFLRGSMRGFI